MIGVQLFDSWIYVISGIATTGSLVTVGVIGNIPCYYCIFTWLGKSCSLFRDKSNTMSLLVMLLLD
tara:strand:- start:201 stop:398 length:198 start_codon:yes stop_codon:yes gene_type:complete